MSKRTELLAPAGSWECARAAVANGADAIYFGLDRFNARMRAENFTEADLPGLMRFLWNHGVRGYAALNTLTFTKELDVMEETLRTLNGVGVDAVIVQDIGVAAYVKKIAPGLRLHASTQMTLTSPESLDAVRDLELDRAVLARELSLRELDRFSEDVPLEVFVHGALCVAYSGQCLTSESLGRRSANRGECAQACRMPYEMVVDGKTEDLGDRRYLLSPSDLAGIAEVPRLVALGVQGFKIEGRLKSPEYVAAVTRAYRKALDSGKPVEDRDRYELEMMFSRGLYSGWLNGVNHQELVGARFGKRRGPFVGRVTQVGRDAVEIDGFSVDLKPGDGVVFDQGGDPDDERGGRVYEVNGRQIGFRTGLFRPGDVARGDRVWKTSDPELEKQLRATYATVPRATRKKPLSLRLAGGPGRFLELEAMGEAVLCRAEQEAEAARGVGLTGEQARKQLEKLGDTPWILDALEFDVEPGTHVPVATLNQLRRDLTAALEVKALRGRSSPPPGLVRRRLEEIASGPAEGGGDPKLNVLCRTVEQMEAARGVDRVYLDLEDLRGCAGAVARWREIGGGEIFLATPRIHKPAEAGFLKLLEKAGADGILARNLASMSYFVGQGLRVAGDFSLNVANPLTADWFRRHGVETLTVSYDLNAEQALDLLKGVPKGWMEVTLHQHMPMFHMEHCVFAAFLSEGTDFTNCGRPCEKHKVELRDRVGQEHPLLADSGCRNTLFNARAQSGAVFATSFREADAGSFRVELLRENAAETEKLINSYRSLLKGEVAAGAVLRDVSAESKLGVTAGAFSDAGHARKVAAPDLGGS